MYTLIEYIEHTKAVSYLVALVLMVGFVPFWSFVTERESRPGPS